MTIQMKELSWANHEELMGRNEISEFERGFRGCAGLALWLDDDFLPGTGKRRFLPAANARWVTLVNIPPNHFFQRHERAVSWVAVYNTTIRRGLPHFGSETELGDYDRHCLNLKLNSKFALDGYDYDCADRKHAKEREPQLQQIASALNWAMASAAFYYRSSWRDKAAAYKSFVGVNVRSNDFLLLGSARYHPEVTNNRFWSPKPLLGFHNTVSRDRLWDLLTTQIGFKGRDYYPKLRSEFVEDLRLRRELCAPFSGRLTKVVQMKAGRRFVFATKPTEADQYGPQNDGKRHLDVGLLADGHVRRDVKFGQPLFLEQPIAAVEEASGDGWEETVRFFGENLDQAMRAWFDWQCLEIIPGVYHVPARIAAYARSNQNGAESSGAIDLADDSLMLFDLSESMNFFNDYCEAFIFPPLRMNGWSDFRLSRGGNLGLPDITVNLTPEDRRLTGNDRYQQK